MERTSCPYCSFSTVEDFDALFDHLEKHEFIKETSTNLYKCAEDLSNYKCKNCDYNTPWQVSLLNHIYKRECNRQVVDLIDVNVGKGKRKEYKCEFCTFKTIWRHSWRNHNLRKHTPVENITWLFCEFCSYKCKFAIDLKTHQLNHGIDMKKKQNISTLQSKLFGCTQCSYKSSVQSYLKAHILRKHTPAKNIKWLLCDQCPYKSKSLRYLEKHKRKHNIDQKYKCIHCPFETPHKNSWKNHFIYKHPPQEEMFFL